MRIQVLPFGLLKDWLGASAAAVELPEGATVADLLARLSESRPAELLRGIAVSVNTEYATAACLLHEGDEVGLLPPVSEGRATPAAASSASGPADSILAPVVVTALTREPIDAQKLIAEAKRGDDGALVVFDGIVRNQTRGRQTLYLDYEAYEEMAIKQLHGAPAGAAGNLRDQHSDRGRLGASRGGLRGLPLADRYDQENRARLEEGDLSGRGRVGRWRAVSR